MNHFNIKIDNQYFAGINEEVLATAPAGGWYDTGRNVRGLLLAFDQEHAKLIEGNTNLKSYFNKIHDVIRYGKLDFKSITIEKVGEE